jgi:hypothetical protein
MRAESSPWKIGDRRGTAFRHVHGKAGPGHYLPVEIFLQSGYSLEATNFSRLDFGFTETTVETLRRLHADLGKRPEVIWR